MALPGSGKISLHDIYVEIYGSHSTQQVSLRTMASAASKAQPDTIGEFYNYSQFSVSPDTLYFDFEGVSCDPGAGEVYVDVGSGVRWDIKNYASWVNPQYTTGFGPGYVSFTTDSNLHGSSRLDIVDISTATSKIPLEILQSSGACV
jgi:hypothetical protein